MELKKLYPLIALLTFVITSSTVLAQTKQPATLRGFVYDKKTGEPIIFTNVFLQGTTLGSTTDVNGFFQITKLEPGKYTVKSTTIGYDTASVDIELKPGQILTQKLFISEKEVNLKTFEVSAEKQEMLTEVKISVQKVTPKEITSIPSVGGEADLAQYLQVLPGVIFTGDQGGQLYIRGGSPIQNLVMLDGMVIYNPFHSIGLFSVFETDILKNADVYTGGFNAEYGGRISSVMDITTRDGNNQRLSGKVGASTFGAKAILEGPLRKPKTDGDGSISFLTSVKTSYLDQTSKSLYNYVDHPEKLPYSFRDLYGKLTFKSSNGSKFNLFGFNYNDRVNYSSSNLNWDASGLGGNFIVIPETSPLFIQGNFSYSKYLIEQKEVDRDRTSGINSFNLGLNFTYFLKDDELKYGIQVLGFGTEFRYVNTLDRVIEQNQSTTEIAGYFRYKLNRGKWVVEPSMRVHYYASLSEFSLEPRLGAKYNATSRMRFKAAGGLYAQNLISAQSDRDVVNLFNGFLGGPDNLPKTFVDRNGNTGDVGSRLQKSVHAIVGTEYDVTRNWNVNIEGYLKYFPQLTILNRYRIFDDVPANVNRPDILKKDFIIEDGYAYGLDFSSKYEYKNIYFWAVYSISYVDRWDGNIVYNPVFDRRHNVNFVANYSFGKDKTWELSGRWNFGSGFPFTQTQGYFEKFDFVDGIGTDYTTGNGQLGVEYASINQGRLPSYHRFDFNVKKTLSVSNYSTLEMNAGVTNLYNRENIFYYDRIRNERVNQLPIMPSLGATLTF